MLDYEIWPLSATILCVLRKRLPCCRSITSPFSLSSITSTRASSSVRSCTNTSIDINTPLLTIHYPPLNGTGHKTQRLPVQLQAKLKLHYVWHCRFSNCITEVWCKLWICIVSRYGDRVYSWRWFKAFLPIQKSLKRSGKLWKPVLFPWATAALPKVRFQEKNTIVQGRCRNQYVFITDLEVMGKTGHNMAFYFI